MISGVKVSDRWLLALVGVLLVASVLARYSGISHGSWNNVFQALAHPERFSQDIFIQGSGVVNSSLMFPLIRWLGLDFTNDVVGMALNLGLHVIAIGAFYGFVRALAPGLSVAESAVLVLLAVFLDNKVESVRAGLVVSGTLSPSWIGQCLIPVVLLCLARGWKLAVVLVLVLAASLAMKLIWLPFLAGLLAAMMAPAGQRRHALLYLLPFGCILWLSRSVGSDAEISPDDIRRLTEWVIWRDFEECTLRYHPITGLLALALSVPVYFVLARRVESPELRRFLIAVGVISIAANVWNEIYIAWGYQLFPRPVLVLLQPIRALALYVMLFCTLLAVAILRSDRLRTSEKAVLLVALALFRVDKVGLAVFPPEAQAAIVVAMGFVLPGLFRLAAPGPWGRMTRALPTIPVAWLVVALLSPLVARHVIASPTVANFNQQAWQHVSRWTFRWPADAQAWSAVQTLAQDRQDYPLLVVDGRPGRWDLALPANEIALKAQFRGEPSHFAFGNLALYEESMMRFNLSEALVETLNLGEKVKGDLLDQFARRDARIMIRDAVLPQFPADIKVEKRFPGWVLLKP